MNPYLMEMLARDRQREMLREAEARRLVAQARGARPSRPSVLELAARAGRSLLAPGRSARIEPAAPVVRS